MKQRRITDHVFSLYGDSETLIGKWFKRTGKRNEIFLSSKFGFVKGSKTYEVDSSAEYVTKACAESLRLLDIDTIDICKSEASYFRCYSDQVLNQTTCIMPMPRRQLRRQ